MRQNGSHVRVRDVHVRVLSHSFPHAHSAESDEEIDGRARFEIGDAVADEGRASFGSSQDVAHDQLFPAGPGEKRAAIEITIRARLVELQTDGMDDTILETEMAAEWEDALLDPSRHEVNGNTRVAEGANRFFGTRHQ